MKNRAPATKVPIFRRAWMLESLFFFPVLWQEAFRLSSRTTHRILPVSVRFAFLLSSIVVAGYELTQSTSTTSDVMDIPAGVAGALFYLLIRRIALRLAPK